VYLTNGQNNEYEKREEEKGKKEENSAGDLPRPQGILDYTDTVLAVGERRHRG
jgi:hypothetical protein